MRYSQKAMKGPVLSGVGVATLVVLLGSVALPAAPAGAPIRIVEKGKPRAVIVIPEPASPGAEEAAGVLREHLKQISGAELQVLKETEAKPKPTADQPWILVGEGQRSKELGLSSESLGTGGIFQQAKDHVLALFGKTSNGDAHGTSYAVTTFLEDKLGVRYLWPGDLGKVIPRQDTVEIAEFRNVFTPKLPQRGIRMMQHHDRLQEGLDRLGYTKEDYLRSKEAGRTSVQSPDWSSWHRLGGRLSIVGGHAFDNYWIRHGKDHPEWFAVQPNGSRDQSASSGRPRLCKSNPGLIAHVAKEKIEELKANPGLMGVSIGSSDGGATHFCSCAKCEALDAPEGRKVKLGGKDHASLTDRMVYFWNAIAEQVAKVLPDKFLVADVYSVYAAPPVKRKLHPNILLRYTSISYVDEEARQQDLKDFAAWSKAAKRYYWRPNLMGEGRRTGFPLLYITKFAQDVRVMADAGVMGTDFDSIVHHWSTQGLNYYVVAKLLWNAHQDVDAIIDDYCRAGFGPAAKSVRRYFDALIAAKEEGMARKVAQNYWITPQVVEKVRKHLEQARLDVSGKEGVYAERVAFLELGLRWTEVEARAFAVAADRSKVDPETAKKVFEDRLALMKEIFQKSPLAIDVGLVMWGDGLGK